MNAPLFGGLSGFIEERRPTLGEIALASAALAEVDGGGDGSLRDLLRRPRGRAAAFSAIAAS
jgi:hypothetical protein